jgi:4-amino-4-deoxy-L-arabinose transferase-like glycosyltransferase
MTAPAPAPGSRARRRAIVAPVAVAAALIAAIRGGHALVATAPLDVLSPAPARPGDPPGTRARTGGIYLPRGGPYILGFASPGPARLEVDGHVIAGRGGTVVQRIVFEDPDVAALRFAAPPGARLVWHPPGRRGAPEWVPASSLLPSIQARADPLAGTTLLDAATATAIVVVLLGLGLWLVRRRIRAVDPGVRRATLLVFALALGVRLWGLGAAGQTWDEDEYWSSGRDDVQNLVDLDFRQASWTPNFEHPPVTKYIAGLGALWADGYGPARGLSALCVALGCALLVPIGARLYRLRVGVAAGAFAALTPHLVAHGQIVGHEAPSVLWWSLAMWLCLRAHDRPPGAPAGPGDPAAVRRLAWRMAGVGVVLGLALMTRFTNALLAPAVGVALVACAPAPWRRRTVWMGLAVIPAVAVVTSVAIWPRLWVHPIAHLAQSWAKLRGTHAPEPFLGAVTATPARSYFLIYLAVATPVALAAAATLWWVRAGQAWAALRDPERAGERRAALVVAAWLIAPLAVSLSPVRQDGVRYVLPCLTAGALMAAAGLDLAAGWLRERPARVDPGGRARRRPAPFTVGAVLLAGYLAVACLRVRPYYLDYYSEIVGGPTGAAHGRRFAIAWWGEGLDDAIAYVNAHAAPGARVHRDCVLPSHLTWFRGDLWNPMVRDPRQADWIVVYAPTWRPCPVPPGAKLVHQTRVLGAPLANVYQLAH